MGPFPSEMQFDNFHSYSWAKAPVNIAGSEQGQPVSEEVTDPGWNVLLTPRTQGSWPAPLRVQTLSLLGGSWELEEPL